MTFRLEVSNAAAKVFSRLDRSIKQRIVERFEELQQDPFDSRLAAPLTNKGDLRKSRVGGWRIIFRVDRDVLEVLVVSIDRRGQVYKRV